jgi:hypothetical protein
MLYVVMPYKDPEKRRICSRETRRRWRKAHPAEHSKQNCEWSKTKKGKQANIRNGLRKRRRDRLECLVRYSGNPPKCECCGESHLEFLAFDHVNGGGAKHRKELSDAGTATIRWLIKNNCPKGFRVLCHNCNSAHGYYGYCPHNSKSSFVDF